MVRRTMQTQSLSRGPFFARRQPWLRLGVCLLAATVLGLMLRDAALTPSANGQESQSSSPIVPLSAEAIERRLQADLSPNVAASADLTAAGQMVHALAPADWLGPLAPIALSPFFGITCLSGLALWGPDWLPTGSLLAQATPLKSPTLFWTFAVLTLLTSLPRFTKVSKPLAFAADHLEAYAAIITLLVIRYLVTADTGVAGTGVADTGVAGTGAAVAAGHAVVLQAGVFSFSLELLFYLAMVINLLVVNSVKFLFEFLIWLTPVPFLDACFEVANKTICAALVGLYAFSPTLATVLNLLLFAVCLLLLRWSHRHLRYYRHMAFEFAWPWIQSSYGVPRDPQLVVFPHQPWRDFAGRAQLTLIRQGDGWLLRQQRFLRSPIEVALPVGTRLQLRPGWVINTLEILLPEQDSEQAAVQVDCAFSRRYQRRLDGLASLLGAAPPPASTLEPHLPSPSVSQA